jgi:hypothetical protein
MCWSEEISWVTFTIGMITSAQIFFYYKRRNPIISNIVVAWQPVIWMQFFEAYVWREVENETTIQFGSYGAIFTSLLQPPIMGIVLISQNRVEQSRKNLAAMLIILYIYWYSYSLTTISPLDSLTMNDIETCRHIDFKFWEKLVYPDLMYSFFVSGLFVLLIPYTDVALFLVIISGGTYTFSYYMYNCGESNGSMWCWVSSLTPVMLAGYFDYIRPVFIKNRKLI